MIENYVYKCMEDGRFEEFVMMYDDNEFEIYKFDYDGKDKFVLVSYDVGGSIGGIEIGDSNEEMVEMMEYYR